MRAQPPGPSQRRSLHADRHVKKLRAKFLGPRPAACPWVCGCLAHGRVQRSPHRAVHRVKLRSRVQHMGGDRACAAVRTVSNALQNSGLDIVSRRFRARWHKLQCATGHERAHRPLALTLLGRFSVIRAMPSSSTSSVTAAASGGRGLASRLPCMPQLAAWGIPSRPVLSCIVQRTLSCFWRYALVREAPTATKCPLSWPTWSLGGRRAGCVQLYVWRARGCGRWTAGIELECVCS